MRPARARAGISRAAALALAASLLLAAAGARAQQVAWAAPGPLGVGQIQKLDLVFDNCQPEGGVTLPEIEGLLVVGEPTESRSFSMVNFKSSSSVTFSYPVRATRAGEIAVPAFEVETSRGRQRVAALRLRAGAARLPGAGGDGRDEALSEIVQAELRVSSARPYAGEVLDVELLIGVDARRQASLAGPPRWTAENLLSEGWGEAEQIRLAEHSGVRMRNRLQLLQPGPMELPAVEQTLNIETGGHGPGFFFSRQMTPVVVATDPVPLSVRPLPEPAAAGFAGAVGRFELDSRLVPEEVRAGEPVTWTLRLSGRGNWPDGVALPARAVPRDMRAIQPRSQRDFPDGGVFEGSVSEDVVLIPERAGELDLPAVRFVYFDPESERYAVAEVGPQRLAVLPAVGSPQARPTPAAREAAPESAPAAESLALIPGASADAAVQLPRDLIELPPSGRSGLAAARPLPRAWLMRLALAPGACVLLAWLALALRRALSQDPLLPRRRARIALLAAIEEVTASQAGDARHAPLLRWQQAAAILLELGHAAPGEGRIEARAPESDATWIELWRDSERAIHGPRAALAVDWPARAARAARRLTLPTRWPAQLLRLRTWLPALLLCLCAGTLAFAAAPAARAEESSADAYRAGHLAEAEAGYRGQVARDPADWRARYNLALARAQQGDRAEALAQTTAAFLLRPQDPSVRWNLALFARDAGAIDPRLRALAFGSGAARLSRWLPARRWQTALLAGAGLLWAALGLALLRRHRGARGRPLWPVAGLAGALLLLVSGLALSGYGELADPGAAMLTRDVSLHSLPTDAEGAGLSRKLAAGQLVRLQRDLLAWVEVELANGERGWLRRSALVPFYEPAVAPAVTEVLDKPSLPAPPAGSSERI